MPSKRRWGNTNQSRGRIRRWSRDYQENIDPEWMGPKHWFEVNVRQLDTSQILEALEEGRLNDSALQEIDDVGIENAEIYEVEAQIRATSPGPKGEGATKEEETLQYAYATREDFLVKDLFTARGKGWRQPGVGGKGSSEFDYFVFEIQTPVGKGEA